MDKRYLVFLLPAIAVLLCAAAGQYTYERKIDTKVMISAERMGTYLSLLRTDNAWPSKVPLGALYHCDLWINKDANGKVTDAKVECHGKETGVKVTADTLPEGAKVTTVHN